VNEGVEDFGTPPHSFFKGSTEDGISILQHGGKERGEAISYMEG
jgi:hypothetical protein